MDFKYFSCVSLGLIGLLLSAQSHSVTIGKQNLVYQGAFRVPQGDAGNNTSFSSNPWVNAQYQPMAYNPTKNSLFLGQSTPTQEDTKRIGEISIPELVNPLEVGLDINKLNTATVLQQPTDISGGTFDNLNRGGKSASDPSAWAQLGGLYVFANTLIGTAWAYYDASSSNSFRSHYTANLDWSDATGFSGLHAVGESPNGLVANGGFVGGYMTQVPAKHLTTIGYPMLTGRTGGPIVGRSSQGPTIWGFDPSKLNFDEPAPATMFIGYPIENSTLGDYSDRPSLTYNRATGISGVVWPENTDSIMFFGSHGLGIMYDNAGVPLNSTAKACQGPGTSNPEEAADNSLLKSSGLTEKTCGYHVLSKADIDAGLSCCYDPIDNTNTTHRHDFVIGNGTSCYGPGTRSYSEARTSTWLKANVTTTYQCGETTMNQEEIAADNACCFVGSNSTAKGGSSYPSVYQVWQYSIDDVIAVKDGTKRPWELIPRVWNFDLPFDSTEKSKQIQAVAYDSVNQRVFIAQAFGDGNYPLVHVFNIELGSSPPEKLKNFGAQKVNSKPK